MSASVWKKRKMSDFAKIYSGTDYKHNKKGEQFPIIGTGGVMGFTGEYLNEGPAVLTGRKGTIDKPLYVEGKFWNVDTIFCIKPFDDTDIKLFYYAISNKNLSALNEATGVPSVSSDNLYKLTFSFPVDINEQKRIASILSACDTVIQNTQKTIDKYKAIKQGMMQDLFTRGLTKDGKLRPSYKEAPELYKESELGMIPKEWNIEPFGNLVTMHARIGWQNLRTTEFLDSGDYYLITGTDFEDGKVNFETCHYVSKNRFEQDKNIQVQVGSILITKDGTLGKVAYIDKLSKPATLNAGVFNIVTKNDDIVQNYLYHFLTSPALMNYALQRATGGTIKHLNQNILVKFPVICPPKDEQENIAKSLSAIAKSILKEEAVLEKYKNIKTGLMARLLTPPEDAEIIDETGE